MSIVWQLTLSSYAISQKRGEMSTNYQFLQLGHETKHHIKTCFLWFTLLDIYLEIFLCTVIEFLIILIIPAKFLSLTSCLETWMPMPPLPFIYSCISSLGALLLLSKYPNHHWWLLSAHILIALPNLWFVVILYPEYHML